MTHPKELPTLPFPSVSSWERWLSSNYQTNGVWIKIAKKATGIASVSHDEALDVALCYGWIDGQRNSFDDTYFLQKFTPRRPSSLWSKRNIDKIAVLTTAGKMQPPGLAEVNAAQHDGRWEAAYASQKNMVFPEDFLQALQKSQPALDYFNSLSKTNIYAIAWRLQTAKRPETRKRRFEALLAMLERKEFR